MQIISGGQTGADRAALDFAIAHDIPHGGWCPKGRLAEDGLIPARYQLTEMRSAAYPARTEKKREGVGWDCDHLDGRRVEPSLFADAEEGASARQAGCCTFPVARPRRS